MVGGLPPPSNGHFHTLGPENQMKKGFFPGSFQSWLATRGDLADSLITPLLLPKLHFGTDQKARVSQVPVSKP